MKRVIFIVTIMIVSFMVLVDCSNQSNDGKLIKKNKNTFSKTKGELKSNTPTIDIGSVSKDTILEVSFPLTNMGSEQLKIIEYSVSCNCTSANLNDSLVFPGNTSIFHMKINTKGKSLGAHQTDAVIKTNGQKTFYKLTAKYITH